MVGQVPDHFYITCCIYKNGEILLCYTEKNRQNVYSLRVIKQTKMVDLCFGALALNAELKNSDL